MSSAWTHLLCDVCWKRDNPDREPIRVKAEPGTADEYTFWVGPCCQCGGFTGSGIFVRKDPAGLRCAGIGGVHLEST